MRRRVNRNVQAGLRKKSRAMSSTTARSIAVGGWAFSGNKPEKKFVDTSISISPVAGSNAFTSGQLLNSLANGTSASDRIGRKVVMKSIYIRWSFEMAPTGVDGAPLRILVVYDKQANGALAAITAPLVSSAFNSLNNLSNKDRFVTLFDHISDPIDAEGPHAVAGVLYKPINLEVQFDEDTDGGIDDIMSGAVILYVAQQGTIITAAPTFVCRTRIRYTDN